MKELFIIVRDPETGDIFEEMTVSVPRSFNVQENVKRQLKIAATIHGVFSQNQSEIN